MTGRRRSRISSTSTAIRCRAQRGSVVVSAEGIHSTLRKQLYPDEGPPKYSGVNMWRGVTRWKPFMSGASMIRVGWHHPAKLLIYPIRNNIDADGRQLVNWVVDIETPQYKARDWNRRGKLEDFIHTMADWHFDWLDVPDFIRAADAILEYPDGRPGPAAALELRPAHAARRCRASDVSARRQWRGAGDPRLPRARRRARGECRSGRRAQGLRGRAPAGDRQGGSDKPQGAARRHPARGLSPHRRQAVQEHRRRHQPRGAGGPVGELQAGRRLRQGTAEGEGCR